MKQNILLCTDSYYYSHFLQYPPGTTSMYAYLESRGGRYDEIVFFGLQYIIKEYLSKPFTRADIEEAADIALLHGVPFNREEFEYILNNYNGYFPVTIKALPEGTIAPVKVPMVTIEPLVEDRKTYWCVGFIQSLILQVWYPITVATNSREIKKVIKQYLEETGDVSGLPFKLHDFGLRGTSSMESGAIGGMAHLAVGWKGTDTMPALLAARRYYNEKIAGFSIPAAEHSTITSWLRENETEAYRNMIRQFSKEDSIYAVVSDSYDLMNAVENIWGGELKDEVIASKGILVVRPDSGDPVATPIKVVEKLAEKFGTTTNSKGYKVLNNVRVIQGDGIEIDTIRSICIGLKLKGFSIDNIAFGMGGALLQIVNRDDQKFAIKCSAIKVNNVWRDVFKDPITDPGKRSKAGRVTTRRKADGTLYASVVGWSDKGIEDPIALESVYELGIAQEFESATWKVPYIREQSFADIRQRAEV
ncbi:nicotinamide phosphoribosyltransferase [Synechococcus phage BUCT-ZZ01]|nr:nicotinamide phosphoribosyltransferase [Synechococcus phage BUCT-ZZ01]